MGRGATNHSIPSWLAIMDMDTMDDDIGDKLNSNAGSKGNMNIGATTINSLEAVHDEFLLQSDHHVSLEHDP